MSLKFRFWVAYQAFVHGRFLVDRPIYVQVMVPKDCKFTAEDIQKVCNEAHDEISRIVNEINAYGPR
ncbi:MAG TPA: hypothetical protein VGJ92_02480 [Methanocella sp.]|jgi:hypothetical protein